MRRTLLLRKGRYWISYVLRYRSQLIVDRLAFGVIDRIGSRVSFEGIRIVGPPVSKGENPPPFLENTVAALRLVQSVDPRRFRRVQREITTVENSPGISFASYNRRMKRCAVDYARFDPHKWEQHPEWYTWVYAATLVHEATHGAIDSQHIQYTPKLRERIERLCWTEQRRFATRADREDRQWSEALVPPFNAEGYHASWRMTRWQRAKRIFSRYRDIWRDLRTKK